MPITSSVFLVLSCPNFKVSGLILRSLIHFVLIIVQGDKHGSKFWFSVGRYPLFPATLVEEAVFSPLYVFGTFVKNKVGIAVWIHIWVLYFVPLVFISFLNTSTMLLLLLRLCSIV
jgi:hypothetical protein